MVACHVSAQLEHKPRPLTYHCVPLLPLVIMRTLSQLVLIGFSLFSLSHAARFGTPEVLSEMTYTRAHSLGIDYKFHERDGWEPVTISTSLSRRSLSGTDASNSSLPLPEAGPLALASKRTKKPSLADTLVHTINSAWNGLRGSGRSEKVKITWYTGQDLQNPSCWAEPAWAPTVSRRKPLLIPQANGHRTSRSLAL